MSDFFHYRYIFAYLQDGGIDMLLEIELFHQVKYLGVYDKVAETYGRINLKFLFS